MKKNVPYRPPACKRFLRLATLICTAAMSMAAVGDAVRATGFRPPPHRIKIKKADSAKASAKRLKATALPSSWDSRDKGWVTPVKDQGNLNTCWAFASCAIIETQLLRTNRGTWDLSEKNMVALCGFERVMELGGFYDMAAAYLLRWNGAVAETNDIYRYNLNDWDANPSPQLPTAVCIQNIEWIPPLDGTDETRNELKKKIMEYGAAGVPINWNDTYIYGETCYCNNTYYSDWRKWNNGHAIAVVGWDDNYSTNNFSSARRPPNNGAWLIKNSWGESYGNNGYFYVSYYDVTFGIDKIFVFIPATEETNYTAIYSYSKHGPIYNLYEYYQECKYDIQAAVFTSSWNEELAAVGIYSTVSGAPFEISIYTNVTRGARTPITGGTLACTFSGTLTHAGFTTIPLTMPLTLANGTTFSVVHRQTGNTISALVDCTSEGDCYPNHSLGESYFGISGGNSTDDIWYDGADASNVNKYDSHDVAWGVTLKAYTRTTVPAKAGDAPGETADGTEALAALAATNALAYAQHGETFGAFAHIVGANGRTLWGNWLAGLDPANPDDDLTLSIAVTNGTPSLSWTPDLGDARTYTIWGCRDLPPAGGWSVVPKDKLSTTTNRFFKVSVSP